MAKIRVALDSSFELAFRRALFLLILLVIYLVAGSFVFIALCRGESHRTKYNAHQERLDFERTELLNVLWAESIGRSERDWSLLANQKLDSYEKSLANARRHSATDLAAFAPGLRSFSQAFRHSFLLITTIGSPDVGMLSTAAKLFSITYATIGIPLVWLYVGQCERAIIALLPGSDTARTMNRAHLFAPFIALFVTAILFDIVEDNSEDLPFIDAIFGIFLDMSTIGGYMSERTGGLLGTWLFYLQSIFLLGAFRMAFSAIQRRVERRIGNYEFAFTQKVGQIERVISGDRLDEKEITGYREEEEDSETIDASTVPQIKVRESYGLSPEDRNPNSPVKTVHFEFSPNSSSASIDNHAVEEDMERRINNESDNEEPTTMTFTLKSHRNVEMENRKGEDSVADDSDMITTTSF